MSALAKYLNSEGYEVSGSDLRMNEEIAALEGKGVKVSIGHFPEHINEVDAVAYTDAIPPDDPELIRALKLNIPVYTRMGLLNRICADFGSVIAVAGSHGKTTTTCMCAHILNKGGAAFCAHIGGRDIAFDNFYVNGKDYFLTEACEYKQNLLRFVRVNTAVWLNTDKDHMECYKNEEELRDVFYRFAAQADQSVVNGDDKRIKAPQNSVRFSVDDPKCEYTASSLRRSGERYAFTVLERGEKLCRVRLRVPGRFHVENALAAIAAMRLNGVDGEDIAAGLSDFCGVKRRFEKIGEYRGSEFICDYAHHPSEIEKVFDLARKRKKKNLYVVFQPHTYSRTKYLMNEFVTVLSRTERPVIYRTYAAREDYDEEGSAYALHLRIKNSLYAESVRELEAFVKRNVGAGDTVLFLGAGDIYYLAIRLLQKLGGKERRCER